MLKLSPYDYLDIIFIETLSQYIYRCSSKDFRFIPVQICMKYNVTF